MDYIQSIVEEFKDKSTIQTWDVIDKKIHGDFRNLMHPCLLRKELLNELIPPDFDFDGIFEILPFKEREIIRRLNISKLSYDRPSGMLGQAALFEILRNKGFDFRSYVEDYQVKREKMREEGCDLLYTLGYLYYIRRFFGHIPIDLVKYLIEPIIRGNLAFALDEIWLTRLDLNILGVTPNNLANKQTFRVLRNLLCIQDGKGLTASRVMKWTGASRPEATHLIDILRLTGLEHRYRIVSKNTGTVKTISKSKSQWKSLPSFFSACTSLYDNEHYFISISDSFKEDVDGQYCDLESLCMNIDFYDWKEQIWRLHPKTIDAKTTDDIFSIVQTGDHIVPENNILPTKRDLLFIALLTGIQTLHHPKKRNEIMLRLTKGFEIPKAEAENGFRNILRKNMIRNQYSHYHTMGIDREIFTILFDDTPKRTIPFLGDVLSNVPVSWLRTNHDMSYGHILEFHPTYLSCEIRKLIETSLKEHGVYAELLVLHSWGYGQPGSILQLITP